MFSLPSDTRSVPGRTLMNVSNAWGFQFSNSFRIDDNFPMYYVEMMNHTVVATFLEWCSETFRPIQVIQYINV